MRLVGRGLTVTLGGAEVLHDVAFEVAAGESVAIVGPSGSGKSTLLAVLGGLRSGFAGSVRLEGPAEVSMVPAGAVAWVHQVPAALGARSALDNVALGAIAAGAGRVGAESTARDLLDRLSLGSRLHQPARRLSGGELQRVAIGRALAADRPFLLADEPTGQLDARTSADVCRLLVDLSVGSLGRGLVLVTHDRAVADRCDGVLSLVDGRLSG